MRVYIYIYIICIYYICIIVCYRTLYHTIVAVRWKLLHRQKKKTGPGNKHDLLILRKEAGCRAVRAMAEPEKDGPMPGGLASGVMIEPRTPEVGLGW